MNNQEAIKYLKDAREDCTSGEDEPYKEAYGMAILALQKQIPIMADFKHERGDEVALITCPICNRSIIANLERYEEFNKEWYCKDCGQKLTLTYTKDITLSRSNLSSDVIKKADDAIKEMFDNWDDEPNCCDCEFTYDGGDCDNCTMD